MLADVLDRNHRLSGTFEMAYLRRIIDRFHGQFHWEARSREPDVASTVSGQKLPSGTRRHRERRGPPAAPARIPASRLWRRFTVTALAAGLGVLASAPRPAAGQAEGELRLRGGPFRPHNEGRLEIYHAGEWGAVRDDYFELQEATIACEQMGYTGASSSLRGFGGPASLRIWLDDIQCDGTETLYREYRLDVDAIIDAAARVAVAAVV